MHIAQHVRDSSTKRHITTDSPEQPMFKCPYNRVLLWLEPQTINQDLLKLCPLHIIHRRSFSFGLDSCNVSGPETEKRSLVDVPYANCMWPRFSSEAHCSQLTGF